MRVIIPSAGKGKRLGESTERIPKVMHTICGEPLLRHVLNSVDFIAPDDTYIVVGYKKEQVTNAFGDAYHYIEQAEQLGTGHAVMQCADAFRGYDGTVLITFGDMPLFRAEDMQGMVRQHEAHHAQCTLMTAENPDLTLWARVIRNANGDFEAIVEGKDCTPEQAQVKELFSGVICFDSKALFATLPDVQANNIQHEYYLTEVPELLKKRGLRVETYLISDGNDLRGVNTPEDMRICEAEMKKRHGV